MRVIFSLLNDVVTKFIIGCFSLKDTNCLTI